MDEFDKIACLNCHEEAKHVCEDCDEAAYCSTECQKEDWHKHHAIEHTVHAEEIGRRARSRGRKRGGRRRYSRKVVTRRRKKPRKKSKKKKK